MPTASTNPYKASAEQLDNYKTLGCFSLNHCKNSLSLCIPLRKYRALLVYTLITAVRFDTIYWIIARERRTMGAW